MSLVKFELTEEHVKLVKQLRFTINDDNVIEATDAFKSPFGGDNLYEDIDFILNGKTRDVGFSDEPKEIPDDIKEKYVELYKGLPLALEIILSTGSFETGKYKRRFHIRNWVKITN